MFSDFDQAARYNARRHDSLGHLRWALAGVGRDWSWQGWLDTQRVSFPGEPEHRCDTVAAWLAPSGQPVATVVEYLSRPRQEIYARLARYSLAVHEEIPYQGGRPMVPYQVVCILLHLTGPPQPAEWRMAVERSGGLGFRLKLGVRSLSSMSAKRTLRGIASGSISRGVLPWIALMQDGAEPAIIRRWRALAEAEPDPVRRADYGHIARLYAGLADRAEAWKRGLEGFTVERSPYVLEIERKAEARTRRDVLRQLLESKAQAALPSDLARRINEESSPEQLAQWFEQALAVSSVQEFQSALAGH